MPELVGEPFSEDQISESLRLPVDCRLCSSRKFRQYLTGRGYRIVQCQDCDLWYVNPQPSSRELAEFYSDFDRESSWRGDGEERFDRAVRRQIRRIRREGSVLDVGCSRGNFLLSMRAAGFSVHGVEPSPKNSDFARQNNGITTFTGTVEQFLASGAPARFDIITMLNVLEHLRDPKGILLELRQLLLDNGLIVLVVPDARLHAAVGGVRRKLGFSDPFWMNVTKHPLVGFDPPPHLCSFQPKTVKLLLEGSGFRTILVRNAPLIFNRDSWKNVAKAALHSFTELLYYASFRRLVVGYSTLVIALKC